MRMATTIVAGLAVTAIGVSLQASGRESVRVVSVSPTTETEFVRVYLTRAGDGENDLLSLRRRLAALGARKINCFLPRLVTCDMPVARALSEDIVRDWTVYFNSDRPRRPRSEVFDIEWVGRCYDAVANRRRHTRAQTAPLSEEQCRLIVAPLGAASRAGENQSNRGPQQNTEFMVGHILVQIVLPESEGLSEDWQSNEISVAVQKIITGMFDYQEDFPRADIDYTFRVVERAPSGVEPISYSVAQAGVWIADVMEGQGYERPNSEHVLAVHDFNEDRRRRVGADWALTAFIVRAVNAPNHNFSGENSPGLSRLGGPYFAIPYPPYSNRGFPLDLRHICRHHVGHMFWALDEDVSGDHGASCSARSGYLNVPNGNKTVRVEPRLEGCDPLQAPIPCFMNLGEAAGANAELYCNFTARMLGISDDNGNNVPDVFDRPPTIVFEGASVETVTVFDPGFRFTGVSQGILNRNPQQSGDKITYAPAIKNVSISVNGSSPFTLLPEDGESDEVVEEFVVDLGSLLPGRNDIDVVARNVYGAGSDEQTKSIVYLGLDYVYFRFDLRNQAVKIIWSVRGQDFGARYDLHRVDVRDGAIDQAVATDLLPIGPTRNGLTPFAFTDRTAAPGQEYTYYVAGTFEIDFRGQPTTFKVDSRKYTVRAAFPIAGTLLSSPAPNPFRDAVWLSVNIPDPTGSDRAALVALPPHTASSSAQSDLSSDVSIQVFDVAGRRVRDLYSARHFPSVITISWDATSDRGEKVVSGMYFIRVKVADRTETRKVLVIR